MLCRLGLQDSDRWDWLAHIRGAVMDRLLGTSAPAVAVTCSALRTVYRDELRRLSQLLDLPVTITFVLLHVGDKSVLKDRVGEREAEGHYMKFAMVDSQIELLEIPCDEGDVAVVDSGVGREEMLENVVRVVQNVLES